MEAKNRQIIDVAIDLFAEKGFQQTTMQEIAETAGVGKGTIYRFYESKEDLVSSLVEFSIKDITEQMVEATALLDNPYEKLRTIIGVEIDYYDKKRNLAKLLVREVLGYRDEFEDRIRQIFSTRTALVEEVIQKGIDNGEFKPVNPTTLAASLEGMIHATVIAWLLFENTFSREEIKNDILTTVFHGVMKK